MAGKMQGNMRNGGSAVNSPKKGQGPALELSNQGKSLFSGTNEGGGAIVTGNVPLRGASTGGASTGGA